MNFREVFEFLSLNPKYRIARHIEYLRKNITIRSPHDKKNFSLVYVNFRQTNKQLTAYYWGRNITFVLLYFSALLAVTHDYSPLTARIIEPIGQVINLIGVGVLTILFIIFSRLITATQTDMLIEHAHLVAIAVKNNTNFTVHPDYKWGLFKSYDKKK